MLSETKPHTLAKPYAQEFSIMVILHSSVTVNQRACWYVKPWLCIMFSFQWQGRENEWDENLTNHKHLCEKQGRLSYEHYFQHIVWELMIIKVPKYYLILWSLSRLSIYSTSCCLLVSWDPDVFPEGSTSSMGTSYSPKPFVRWLGCALLLMCLLDWIQSMQLITS